jgi:hypothetical protein
MPISIAKLWKGANAVQGVGIMSPEMVGRGWGLPLCSTVGGYPYVQLMSGSGFSTLRINARGQGCERSRRGSIGIAPL